MPHSSGPSQDANPSSTPRLQSHIEHLGIASRRHAAEIIKAGDVKVNGVTVREPGFRVQKPHDDVISVCGRVYTMPHGGLKTRTILLNKPRGLICSSDSSEGETVFACLEDIPERLVCVGRLDMNSDGLLLLSNDGDLVNRLTHPRYDHSKEYLVAVNGIIDERVLDFLNSSMKIDGYRIRPALVEYLERRPDGRNAPRHLLRFVLKEGRNRQIRNMCEQAGLRVSSLTRTAINSLRLPDYLRPGQWRDLTPTDFLLLEETPQETAAR